MFCSQWLTPSSRPFATRCHGAQVAYPQCSLDIRSRKDPDSRMRRKREWKEAMREAFDNVHILFLPTIRINNNLHSSSSHPLITFQSFMLHTDKPWGQTSTMKSNKVTKHLTFWIIYFFAQWRRQVLIASRKLRKTHRRMVCTTYDLRVSLFLALANTHYSPLIYIYICMYIGIYIYSYIYTCIYRYLYWSIYIHVYVYIYLYTFMYIYIYIYTYMYIHININMYMCVCVHTIQGGEDS